MKRNILLIVLLGVICFLGIGFVSSKKALSAGGPASSDTVIGCTLGTKRFIYILHLSGAPVRLDVGQLGINGEMYNTFYSNTMNNWQSKKLFILDITSQFVRYQPFFGYHVYDISEPGVSDLKPLLVGQINTDGLDCKLTNGLLSTLGYPKTSVVIK